MKKTQTLLMTVFWGLLLVAALLYIACEYLNFDFSYLSDTSEQTRYVVSTVMILATLAVLPMALRLFKKRKVHAELISLREVALRKWGLVRLVLLGDMLIINTMLYFLFGFESSFGYLAVVLLLAMPFVYPSMDRCLAEVEEVSPENPECPENPENPESPEKPGTPETPAE